MPVDRTAVAAGMTVISSEGNPVGTIKEVRTNDFLVDRPSAPDLYLPYTTVRVINGGIIDLSISSAQLDDLSWADTGDKHTSSIKKV